MFLTNYLNLKNKIFKFNKKMTILNKQHINIKNIFVISKIFFTNYYKNNTFNKTLKKIKKWFIYNNKCFINKSIFYNKYC